MRVSMYFLHLELTFTHYIITDKGLFLPCRLAPLVSDQYLLNKREDQVVSVRASQSCIPPHPLEQGTVRKGGPETFDFDPFGIGCRLGVGYWEIAVIEGRWERRGRNCR